MGLHYWLAGNAGLNSARGMDVFVLRMLCDVQVEVSATFQFFVHGSLIKCGVPLSVIRCNRHPLHLQGLSEKIRLKIPQGYIIYTTTTSFQISSS